MVAAWGQVSENDGKTSRTPKQLLPHLRQYVRVCQALVDVNALNASLSTLPEHTRIGVVKPDRRARVLKANDRARQFLSADHGPTYQDGLPQAGDSDLPVRIGPERLAALLALTPAESELAILLARGRTVGEAAATGRSQNTLRWRLKHIFAKHGLSRQLDLIALLRSLDICRWPRR